MALSERQMMKFSTVRGWFKDRNGSGKDQEPFAETELMRTVDFLSGSWDSSGRGQVYF
jgi:hypothetical protein